MNPQTNCLLQMKTNSTAPIELGSFLVLSITWVGELFLSDGLIFEIITTFANSWVRDEWILAWLLRIILTIGSLIVSIFFVLLPVSSAIVLTPRYIEIPSLKTTLWIILVALVIIEHQYAIFSRFGITWWWAVSTILLLLSVGGYIWLWLKNQGTRHSLATTINE